jgi:hypothetical protein
MTLSINTQQNSNVCHYAECLYAECRYAKCRGASTLYENSKPLSKIVDLGQTRQGPIQKVFFC